MFKRNTIKILIKTTNIYYVVFFSTFIGIISLNHNITKIDCLHLLLTESNISDYGILCTLSIQQAECVLLKLWAVTCTLLGLHKILEDVYNS